VGGGDGQFFQRAGTDPMGKEGRMFRGQGKSPLWTVELALNSWTPINGGGWNPYQRSAEKRREDETCIKKSGKDVRDVVESTKPHPLQ